MSHTGIIMEIHELKRKISGRYFDYQKLVSILKDQSHIRRFVGNLIKKNYLIRIKKGLYLWSDSVDQKIYSKEVLANLIYGPSYVSLEYALAFYGLIPERVEVLTSVTPAKNKNFNTPIGQFSYHHLHHDAYSLGMKLQIVDKEESFLIATKEKALLDTICIRSISFDKNKSISETLEEDLRIDREEFHQLNQTHLLELSVYYKNSNVKEFIKRIRHG